MKVIKRDGRIEEYNKKKIKDAIAKANLDTEEKYRIPTEELLEEIVDDIVEDLTSGLYGGTSHPINKDWTIEIEEIQDTVELCLQKRGYFILAKNYIKYRYSRELVRKSKQYLIDEVAEKIEAVNVQNQNANVDEKSFGGRMGEANRVVMKDYALNNCVSKMARENHLNNEIYIHDLDSYAVGMHNCVGRETEFLTTEGVKSFYDYQDGDEIQVLTHTGEIKRAKVKKYGVQQLYNITFKKGGNIHKTIRATKDHRWLLQDGNFTNQLKVGDKIADAPEIREFNFKDASYEEKMMWCKGFGYGDGTLEYNLDKITKEYKKDNRVRIRLCNKKKKYLSRFEIEGCSINTPTENGDPIVKIYNYNKTIPNFQNYNELKAFVNGLYCADGYKGKHYGIQFTGATQCDFVRKYFESCGYYIISCRDKTEQITNFGKRTDKTVEYSFLGKPNRFKYTVEKIEPDSIEEVWCLEVEDNHTFILSGGIVTGNCLSIPFDKLLANGFNTRQTDVRPANSVNTAFQLVAVIFQLQSLQQFGGVSSTHLDWTMVPYVRKSFRKHYIDGLKYIEGIDDIELFNHTPEDMSIEDEEYKVYPKVYKYAMDMTVKETKQAVEGMYHNLNY